MSKSKRLRRTGGIALAVIGVVMAIGASSSMAAVEAKFSPSNQGMKWSGSIKIFKNGGSEKTCTFPTAISEAEFGSFLFGGLHLKCSESTELWWGPYGSAYFGTSYYLEVLDGLNEWGPHPSPYGEWGGVEIPNLPWTNGAGATPSHITFSNTYLGNVGSSKITATGTINATTTAGGLLTLTH